MASQVGNTTSWDRKPHKKNVSKHERSPASKISSNGFSGNVAFGKAGQRQQDCMSVQFSLSLVFNSLRTHGLQHAPPPCPSPTPGVHPNPCPLNWLTPSNHLILCRPLLLLPSIFPSIRVFSNESALCIRWLKYWSFSFSISHSKEYSGLTAYRMDWLDLLTDQVILKSLLQHHSSKAAILHHSAFFIVQL